MGPRIDQELNFMTRLGKGLRARFGLPLAMLAVVLCVPTLTRAGTVIYSNLGPGGAFDPFNPWCVTGTGGGCGPSTLRMVAAPFTPNASYQLMQVDMALQRYTGTNQVLVSIQSDSGGLPSGISLASWSFSNLPAYTGANCCQLQSGLFQSGPLLAAGATYWLVVAPGAADTGAGWMHSSTGGPNPLDFYEGVWHSTTGPSVAFDAIGAEVPEPSSLLLLGGGLLYLRRIARRRRGVRP
jgi:hypothetical protein